MHCCTVDTTCSTDTHLQKWYIGWFFFLYCCWNLVVVAWRSRVNVIVFWLQLEKPATHPLLLHRFSSSSSCLCGGFGGPIGHFSQRDRDSSFFDFGDAMFCHIRTVSFQHQQRAPWENLKKKEGNTARSVSFQTAWSMRVRENQVDLRPNTGR